MKNTSIYRMKIGNTLVEIHRKNIKRMNLSVRPPDGEVRISVPMDTKEEEIRRFVKSKEAWITRHIDQIQRRPRKRELMCRAGENHFLWGRPYELVVKPSKNRSQAVWMEDHILLSTTPYSERKQREAALREMYRRELKKKIPPLLESWDKILGVEVRAWGVKDMKTRWGSCNTVDKRIWMNLQLAKYPVACLEYVLVHELIHLLVRNHNATFYAYLDQFLPDWRSQRARLAEHAL